LENDYEEFRKNFKKFCCISMIHLLKAVLGAAAAKSTVDSTAHRQHSQQSVVDFTDVISIVPSLRLLQQFFFAAKYELRSPLRRLRISH